MSHVSHLKKNIPWNRAFPERNITNVWILSIGIKEPTTVTQVMESISSQQLTWKYNRIQVITPLRDLINR